MTEFKLFLLSEYLVGIELVECESERSKALAISTNKFLWIKWNEYEESQLLSLILKLPVITKTFQIFALVYFKYFKIDWWVSK